MANLTLSLDDSLLQQAREAAVRDQTSVNALVREALDTLDAIALRTNSQTETKWSREELHNAQAAD